ncbi:SDR family oxidoreductase [Agrococcus jejuensis]|uniref:Short-chain dehydrogenase involved in D-alanine esterification of teichoic acids n=1 Tax=Agrococcus jejuensis TaxID=399736 RepID=A0A1G8EN47_9MICO|nr:SDR family NAD(P)-dependent oxidoreductase [Agrococcus jejuensis]SDH71291.1 Short-chain dehydrogenase involved in D-alanine esterification of teichoic acids [Agrococcus jejuensis]
MRIPGRTILMAGGTSGIGLALSLELQAKGATVIVAGRRQERLDAIRAEHGLDGYVVDVTDAASIVALAERVTTEHPELDAIVTMSGIMQPEQIGTPGSLDLAERTIATNLLGSIRLVEAFLPHLLTRPEAAILTVTSGLAYVPLSATPTYSATKAGVHSYTEALREQLRETSVQVIEIAPPLTRTTLNAGTDVDDALPLDEFVTEVVTLLETQPDAPQVLVERVKRQRFAVANGTYDEVFVGQNRR